jgi:hypothetical protein
LSEPKFAEFSQFTEYSAFKFTRRGSRGRVCLPPLHTPHFAAEHSGRVPTAIERAAEHSGKVSTAIERTAEHSGWVPTAIESLKNAKMPNKPTKKEMI